ncbi:MAG: hypothetical protein JOZ78_04420 [Chroococcidiopsidaceae cyanobacterium CP_BM_ER_R8_30]|nr:hypothetical protein [Chroococcidiopsidaceae cyanobacterium CP_BM_ER_R8_30]
MVEFRNNKEVVKSHEDLPSSLTPQNPIAATANRRCKERHLQIALQCPQVVVSFLPKEYQFRC